MAAVSLSPSFSFCSVCRGNNPSSATVLPSPTSTSSCSLPVLLGAVRFHKSNWTSYPKFIIPNKKRFLNLRKIRTFAGEEAAVISDEVEGEVLGEASSAEQAAVSVPVSPSDVLTMFFQADGTMSESDVPKVTRALEVMEGVSDLRVEVLEGIASVELKQQTTVQATGVAANLVEIIQGSGFKLQTLNLSFEDDE